MGPSAPFPSSQPSTDHASASAGTDRKIFRMSASQIVQSVRSEAKRGERNCWDDAFALEIEDDFVGDTSWSEVFQSCFVHSGDEWILIVIRLVMFVGCLYFFGVGLEFLGSGATVMTACATNELFAESINPVAGVMIGVLVSVLLQSSTTTTSIVVGLVGDENSLVNVQQGIYIIMGANIGTTITNTIVSLGHFRKHDELELTFAGATVHDIFNIFTVAILLPLEVSTSYLERLTTAMVRGANTEDGEQWEGPAKRYIKPLAEMVLIANKKVVNEVERGGNCDVFYPINCTDPFDPTYDSCDQVGLIACSKSSGECPVFFDANASKKEDQMAGLVVFCIGLVVIFASLQALVVVLVGLLRGVSIRVVHKATDLNGYVLIAIGCGLAMFLQSSSTATSFLVPVVGIGALRLEQMYPLTIGANLGTTITALLAAMATDGNHGLQIALAHLMFNITGMMVWYPIPVMRRIPIYFARRLGRYARVWRSFVLFYILGTFFLVPGIVLGISTMFLEGSRAVVVCAIILTALLGGALIFWVRWCCFQGGGGEFYKYLLRKRDRYYTLLTITTDLEKAKLQVRQHREYVGIPDDPVELEVSQRELPNVTTRQIAVAERRIAHDMHFIKEAISMLYYHTGLPEYYDPAVEDDGNSVSQPSSSERDIRDEEATGSTSDDTRRKQSKGRMERTLLQEIPQSFWAAVVSTLVIFILGVTFLFKGASKASDGGAIFVLVLLCMLILYAVSTLSSESGRSAANRFFRNHRTRNETIRRLPVDIPPLKNQVKELLAHYKLEIDDLPSSHDTSSFDGLSGALNSGASY